MILILDRVKYGYLHFLLWHLSMFAIICKLLDNADKQINIIASVYKHLWGI